MPPRPPTDEQLVAVAEAIRQHPTKQAAADALGLPVTTLKDWERRAARRGLLGTDAVLPGFRLSKVSETQDAETGIASKRYITQKEGEGPSEPFTLPPGHRIIGGTVHTDAEGRVIESWPRYKEGALDPLELAERLKQAFSTLPAREPVKPSQASYGADLLTLHPLPDLHIGMRAWGQQSGTNWDLDIAERSIGTGILDVIDRSPPSGNAIILGGGDLIHVDTSRNETAAGTRQDVTDDRFQKIIDAACRLMEQAVDAARRHHEQVTVRILPGNHDTHSHLCVTFFLKGLYRDCPTVTIDDNPAPFFWHRFGKVLLGATHGHQAKPDAMPAIMATDRPDDWAKSEHRAVHTFHLHHKQKMIGEYRGVEVEVHRAPIPQDDWHASSGYRSGRSLQGITYHRLDGEHSRVIHMVRAR